MTQILRVSAESLDVRTGANWLEIFLTIYGLGRELQLAGGREVALSLSIDEADHLAEALRRAVASARARSAPPGSQP